MRGIHAAADADDAAFGIIPAHAGHTARSRWPCSAIRDHPRTCGAYTHRLKLWRRSLGSSPHMRGIRHHGAERIPDHGIIPAHAGHTRFSKKTLSAVRDHPRTCGAYFGLTTRLRRMVGSSPHMRGIPDERQIR